MNKLVFFSRPYVTFDAANQDHRRWFAEFQATSSWGSCPVRFVVDAEGSMIPIMQRQLLAWYAEQEFGPLGKDSSCKQRAA